MSLLKLPNALYYVLNYRCKQKQYCLQINKPFNSDVHSFDERTIIKEDFK